MGKTVMYCTVCATRTHLSWCDVVSTARNDFFTVGNQLVQFLSKNAHLCLPQAFQGGCFNSCRILKLNLAKAVLQVVVQPAIAQVQVWGVSGLVKKLHVPLGKEVLNRLLDMRSSVVMLPHQVLQVYWVTSQRTPLVSRTLHKFNVCLTV